MYTTYGMQLNTLFINFKKNKSLRFLKCLYQTRIFCVLTTLIDTKRGRMTGCQLSLSRNQTATILPFDLIFTTVVFHWRNFKKHCQWWLMLSSRRTEERLHTTYLRPIITHACKTWASTKGDDKKPSSFVRTVKKKICELWGVWKRRRKRNDELLKLNRNPIFCLFIRSKSMGGVTCGGRKNAS